MYEQKLNKMERLNKDWLTLKSSLDSKPHKAQGGEKIFLSWAKEIWLFVLKVMLKMSTSFTFLEIPFYLDDVLLAWSETQALSATFIEYETWFDKSNNQHIKISCF